MKSQAGYVHVIAPRHPPVARFVPLLLGFLLPLSQFVKLRAQDSNTPPAEQILASYEGQAVISVDIAGSPDLNIARFAAQIAQQPGQAFDKQKVDSTAAALKAAGNFQNVRVQVVPEAKGLRVSFVVEPAVYYGIFQFPGAERFPYPRLVQVANYVSQAPYNAAEIEHDRQLLIRFFQQNGYFQSRVSTELKIDTQHGFVNIQFHSDLGRKAKFGAINIAGLPPADSADMQRRLTTVLARARGAAIRNGKTYNRSTLDRATKYLTSRLQKEGFLAAQVKLDGADYHSETNRADIHFSVKPGAKTNVQIAGAHLWPWTKKTLLPEYQGVGVDEETLQEGQQALISYFQAKGYFDVKVTSAMSGDEKLSTVAYNINKGRKHKVTEVRLTGESQLKADSLEPHIAVQKKHFFSHGKFSDQLVRTSANNLKAVYQSQGFSSVQITSSVVNHGGDVQVAFHIAEGPRDIVNTLFIEGARTFPQSQFAPKGLRVAAGQPYSQANVEADRVSIVANYLKAGYLTSSFRETAVQVSKNDPHHINVVYHIYEGPRVFTGDVLTLGRVRTQQRLINQDIATIKPEQPLTETSLLTAGSKLYDHAGVFDWSEVDPKSQITTQSSEDVLVKVHEAKRNDFTYGFGFEVINRGGSVPSGTVAIPNLPPVGLPSNFTDQPGDLLRSARHRSVHPQQLGRKGRIAFFHRLRRTPRSTWRPSTTSTRIFAGHHGNPPPLFLLSATKKIRSSRRSRKSALTRSSASLMVPRRIFFSSITASAKRTSPVSKFQSSFLPPISTSVSPVSEQTSPATPATTFSMNTRGYSILWRWISIPLNSARSVDFAKLTSQAAFYKEKFHHIVWANSIRIGLAQPYAEQPRPSERSLLHRWRRFAARLSA